MLSCTAGVVGIEPMTFGFGAGQSMGKKLNKTNQLGTRKYPSRRRFSDEPPQKNVKQTADKMQRKSKLQLLIKCINL